MFDPREILEEFEEAAGMGREWFARDSYRICRTSTRLVGPRLRDDTERFRAYKATWMRDWRKRCPDVARSADKTRYARQMADPRQREHRRRRDADAQRRRRATPQGRERTRRDALRYYHQRMADPAKREAQRRYDREQYHRRKLEPPRKGAAL